MEKETIFENWENGFYVGEIFFNLLLKQIEKVKENNENYNFMGELYGLAVFKSKLFPPKEAFIIKNGELIKRFYIK